MPKRQRPPKLAVLDKMASPAIRALIGIGAVVWRYTVLVPVEEAKPGEEPKRIATDDDLLNLQEVLTKHFLGLTILPISVGYGLRENQIELNKHAPLVVYASATSPSDLYFQKLRRELEDALVQETILVERQEVWLH
jgi:hypothetical protein